MPFEIEFNFRKNEDALWLLVFAVLIIAALVGMAQIGQNATPIENDTPQLLRWSDWQMLQAQGRYTQELTFLRTYAMDLAQVLEQQPMPVSTQFLVEQIMRETKEGDPALANARLAVANAALNVRDWSTGTLDRDTAIQSVQALQPLLQH